jgi:histidinol-phosphate aminotransferase
VIVTNPHNPSGRLTSRGTIAGLAQRIAPVPLFVDEAYAEFSGESLLDPPSLAALPNLIIGRTFSKAYGLAGLRCGALVASPALLEPLRPIVPPFNLNVFAAAALPAAIADVEYRDWYVGQANESRRLLGAACDRLGLQTWPSATNFLLVRVGPSAASVVASLAARGILVRDRSREPGCEGCVRITTGLVADTERLAAALEEAVCGAR